MGLILPNVIGVGFGRSGTTSISQTLSKHPEVCFSTKKETHFFSRAYDAGLGFYSEYFAHFQQGKHKIIAEWSVDYILDKQALLRIKEVFGDSARLLVSYRNPGLFKKQPDSVFINGCVLVQGHLKF